MIHKQGRTFPIPLTAAQPDAEQYFRISGLSSCIACCNHSLFSKYSLLSFLFVTVIVQITHDLLFAQFFMSVPRGRSAILDTFKDYAKESGFSVLFNDALMMICTVLIASVLAGFSLNTNILIFLFSLYLVPYFLFQLPFLLLSLTLLDGVVLP